jgi:coenzyme F420-reducing hydrogenase alpha subunit
MEKQLELQNKKIELIQWLSTIEDIKFLEKISDLISKEKKNDWWDNSSDSEKKAIELGISEAEEGKLNEHYKARDIYAKWL